MGIKNFGVGGIDQKSNNLLRDKADLIDSRNMMASINNEYSKRPGTEEDIDFSDVYSDVIFIKSLNEYFFRSGTDYISYKNGVRKEIYKWSDPALVGTSNISLAEYLNTAIFTHETNQAFTAKYDGRSIYRAGLPTPKITITLGTDLFMLSFFEYVDSKGNTIYGPATIQNIQSQPFFTYSFTVDTLNTSGFYSGYINSITPTFTINAANRTILWDTCSDDFKTSTCIGTGVVFRETVGDTTMANVQITNTDGDDLSSYTVVLIIESIAAGSITFTADSISNFVISINTSTGEGILGSLKLRSFFSTEETTGYLGARDFYSPSIDGSLTNVSILTLNDRASLLSDFYDITTSKLRPPKCKYVCTYGYQIAYGNVISFYDFDNKETTYTNNDLAMYSDLSTGDLGENLSESNRQLIGNTYDGEITGLTRVKDSLIVFKDRSAFALDGALIPGQYTMRKIETNEIGCLSFKSILTTDTSVVFQGQDGLYSIDGYKAEKVTTKLDPFFRTIDTSLTRSVMNNDMDQYLFYTDLGIVVFDYEFKKWYIWDSIDASSGITVDNEAHIRFFSPTIVSKFNVAKNDSGIAINAYIRSAWLDSAEPGLLKKATFLRIYAFNNPGQNISLKYFLDWSEAKFKGPFLFDMDGETIKRNLDVIQNQSFSFEFRNNVIDEDLNISGYEVSAAVVQERDKNVK